MVSRDALKDVVLAVGRDMACGCVEVKRVNVSEGPVREAIVWKTSWEWSGVREIRSDLEA